MSTASSTRLLIIDPQNDFCDLPGPLLPGPQEGCAATPLPALPVPGADADMRRLADLIRRIGAGLAGIEVSLDSHHPMDIAHPGWWRDESNRTPAPFTVIGLDDVASGRWRTRDPAVQQRSLDYVRRLQEQGRYALVVWPEHCLIGHWGHNLHAAVADSLDRWSREQGKTVDYLFKGSNPFTEHYSALRAEVPDPADPAHAGQPGPAGPHGQCRAGAGGRRSPVALRGQYRSRSGRCTGPGLGEAPGTAERCQQSGGRLRVARPVVCRRHAIARCELRALCRPDRLNPTPEPAEKP
jgi:nicotinamidase-related amidase